MRKFRRGLRQSVSDYADVAQWRDRGDDYGAGKPTDTRAFGGNVGAIATAMLAAAGVTPCNAAGRPIDGMTFGQAIEAMKQGKKVSRRGWNGKGMYIWIMPGSTITNCPNITDPHLKAISDANGGTVVFVGSVRMKTATGEVLTGWLASQTDMLSEDWCIVE